MKVAVRYDKGGFKSLRRFEKMKKWYDEEYVFTIEVTGYLRGKHTEHLCRNGEEILH